MLDKPRPDSIRNVFLPRRQNYFPSPSDWRDEVLYFLLVDRFSDGEEASRPLLNRQDPAATRPKSWQWISWAHSGAHRWQGGNLVGVKSKLSYLKTLGITTIWLSPVFKQRGHLGTYHGYGIQDFLEIDPRFGTRQDLVDLVSAAHDEGLRIVLDIIFNHSGSNWVYENSERTPPFKQWPDHYENIIWLDSEGQEIVGIQGGDDGVWPVELQDKERYTRAGSGGLGSGNIDDPIAEHKRSDFFDLRDFRFDDGITLNNLVLCYKYWIALTDCDGFRIDTLKHVSLEEARNFCGAIKEFAVNLGKHDFFLLGEVAGGDFEQDRYLDVLQSNLNAALDIGGMRITLNKVTKGLEHPRAYFDGFNAGNAIMGSHRNLGERHVSILDDHDHVVGEKIRFSSEAASEHQVVAGVALQLFSLGITCIYYGTEQALAGPEPSERKWLPAWKDKENFADRYLREAMFGPKHPKKEGTSSLLSGIDGQDQNLPGFGPFGTAGHHCFDSKHPTYLRIAAMTELRKQYPALRYGRQYLRQTSFLGKPFDFHGLGELIAWSRILADEEFVCVLNTHGTDSRGGDILVDVNLNPSGSAMVVVLNTIESVQASTSIHPVGSKLPIKRKSDGTAYIEVRNLGPSEVLVMLGEANI